MRYSSEIINLKWKIWTIPRIMIYRSFFFFFFFVCGGSKPWKSYFLNWTWSRLLDWYGCVTSEFGMWLKRGRFHSYGGAKLHIYFSQFYSPIFTFLGCFHLFNVFRLTIINGCFYFSKLPNYLINPALFLKVVLTWWFSFFERI